HVIDPVQTVKDAEEIDAVGSRLPNEIAHDIVGIVCVADAVCAAQQHLEQNVGCSLAYPGEPLPWIFRQEAHGDIECRAAPAFERKQVRQRAGIDPCDACDIECAHPCCK